MNIKLSVLNVSMIKLLLSDRQYEQLLPYCIRIYQKHLMPVLKCHEQSANIKDINIKISVLCDQREIINGK